MGTLVMRTDRLVLRDFQTTDLDAIHAYASDPIFVRFLDWGPNTRRDSVLFLQTVLTNQAVTPRRDFELAMVTSDGDLIGGCNLNITDIDAGQAILGYGIRKDYQGRGYATEAARAMLGFGFHTLKLHRIFATCDARNLGSARVLERIGMTREGLLREHKFIKGEWISSCLYSILEQEPR